MYIASTGTDKIVKATLDGKFITSVGKTGYGELRFNFPLALHLSKDELLYVADGYNKCAHILQSDLSFVRSISEKCQRYVQGVSTDSVGNIHIGTTRGIIEIFSSVGEYFGQYCSDILQYVGDIACLRNDDCVVSYYVSDTKGNDILVFHGNDSFIHLVIIHLVSLLIKQDISM